MSPERNLRGRSNEGQRLGIEHPNLLILAETSLEQILKAAQEIQPAAMVVDSIQTVYTEQITSAPGSISQVQEVAGQLMWYAKRSSVRSSSLACHQRWSDRRTATVGTYRRYGALF